MSSPKPETRLGTVTGLFRYPVKGMGGESLYDARLGWHGISGDREYAILRLDDRSGNPFLSPRRCPRIAMYHAKLAGDEPVITTPAGDDYPIHDPELIDELQDMADEGLKVVRLWQHAVDAMPISVITTNSIGAASRLVGRELATSRFRPNIVIDTAEDQREYPEDRWTGRTLKTGPDNATMVHIARQTTRCQVINIDPICGDLDLHIFPQIRDNRRNKLGVYAFTLRPGSLTPGTPITVHT
jgi:uncharacterized protein YcbX